MNKLDLSCYLPIETERLTIRLFTLDDADALAKIYGDPVVMQYLGKGALTSAQTRETIESAINNWQQNGFGSWAVTNKADGKLIGRGGLNFLDATSDIQTGFVLDKTYWGRGLGAEMAVAALRFGFDKLNLDQIYAAARATNSGSRALLDRLGMSFVRDANYFGHAAVIYGIQRDKFASKSLLLSER